jgi:hypothetical protein
MTIQVSQLPSAKWTVTNTTQVMGAGTSFTLSVFVGFGFRGGTYHCRSVSAVSFGGVVVIAGNLRGASSTSDSADSIEANGAYTQGFSRLIDSRLSNNYFSTVGTGIRLDNAFYEATTGTVKLVFTNNAAGTLTLSVTAGGNVIA